MADQIPPKPAAPAPAPSPAPAAPAAAAPTPTPAAPAAETSGGDIDFDAFDDKLMSRFGSPSPEPKKPDDKGGAAPAAKKPDDKAGDQLAPKPGDKPEPKPGDKPSGPKELRQQYEATKAERDKLAKEREELAAKVADAEKRIAEGEAKGKDMTAMAERLAKLEQEKNTIESELRAVRMEFSPEFKKQYEEPFNQAAEYAKQEVEQLVITVEQDGEEAQRAATWDDFVALYRLPKGKAAIEINRLFGQAQAPIVLGHLSELQRLDRARAMAMENERKTWKDRESERVARATQEAESMKATWQKVNEDIKAKRPEWFGEDPQDEEGNKLLAEGYRLVDTAFSAHRNALTPQQRVVLDAQVRNRAAAFPRLVYKLKTAQQELEALKAKLAGYEESDPSRGGGKGGGGDQHREPSSGDALTDMANDLRKAAQD